MGTLLLLLFIIFIVIPLVKVGWRVWLLRNSFKQARRNMQDAFNNAYSQQQAGRPQPSSRKKKVFNQADGEYVEFEEIKTSNSEPKPHREPKTRINPEPQVEDAEWEDIK